MVPPGSRVGIVGGSIAGCLVATALARAGAAVTVFERAGGELHERGAGIGLPPPLQERLVAGGWLDGDLYTVLGRSRLWLVPDGDEPVGQVAVDLMPDGRYQLMSMFVAAEVRREGVGRELIEAVVAVAVPRALYLRVMDGNGGAVVTYERSGFRLEQGPCDDEGCLTMRYEPGSDR